MSLLSTLVVTVATAGPTPPPALPCRPRDLAEAGSPGEFDLDTTVESDPPPCRSNLSG